MNTIIRRPAESLAAARGRPAKEQGGRQPRVAALPVRAAASAALRDEERDGDPAEEDEQQVERDHQQCERNADDRDQQDEGDERHAHEDGEAQTDHLERLATDRLGRPGGVAGKQHQEERS
jgi:hypothetical protein